MFTKFFIFLFKGWTLLFGRMYFFRTTTKAMMSIQRASKRSLLLFQGMNGITVFSGPDWTWNGRYMAGMHVYANVLEH